MKKIFGCVLIILVIGAFLYVKGDASGEADSSEVVDLRSLSATMMYGEVNNMLVNPDDYIGKTIRMSGKFMTFEDERTGRMYTFCVVEDNEQCCSQGIEIVIREDVEEEALIEVEGRFEGYEEDGKVYYRLADARLL